MPGPSWEVLLWLFLAWGHTSLVPFPDQLNILEVQLRPPLLQGGLRDPPLLKKWISAPEKGASYPIMQSSTQAVLSVLPQDTFEQRQEKVRVNYMSSRGPSSS